MATQPRERFARLLAQTVERLDGELQDAQVRSLAGAFRAMRWEFPDLDWRACLLIDDAPPRVRLAADADERSTLTVTMDSTVLAAAAAGRTSLGAAFLCGKLRVQGLNPLHLARFVTLIEPLLRSYRAAQEQTGAHSA